MVYRWPTFANHPHTSTLTREVLVLLTPLSMCGMSHTESGVFAKPLEPGDSQTLLTGKQRRQRCGMTRDVATSRCEQRGRERRRCTGRLLAHAALAKPQTPPRHARQACGDQHAAVAAA